MTYLAPATMKWHGWGHPHVTFPMEDKPEHLFDRQVAPNMAFANTTFRFANHKAKDLLPKAQWESMDNGVFEKVVRQSKAIYFKKARFERSDLDILPIFIPSQILKRLR